MLNLTTSSAISSLLMWKCKSHRISLKLNSGRRCLLSIGRRLLTALISQTTADVAASAASATATAAAHLETVVSVSAATLVAVIDE